MQEILETIKGMLAAKSSILFAISVSCFLAGLALIVGTHIEPTTFQETAQKYAGLLLIVAVFATVIGGSKFYSERTIKTVKFIPQGHECWAHVVTQKDGRIDADISSKINKGGVMLKIADQYNHWHILKFPKVKLI